MKTVRILLAVLLGASLALPAYAQQKKPSSRMYKCVDEAGKVFYSDSPDTDCAKGSVLNRQGVVLKKTGNKPASQPKLAKDDPKRVELASAERRDRALMATYMTEQDIDAARDRSLAVPLQSIKGIEGKLEKVSNDLFELKKLAETLASQQKPLPQDLIEDVQIKQKQIGVLETELAQKKTNVEAIRGRYESDKQRYRELKPRTAAMAN
jgi:hypothetical protein